MADEEERALLRAWRAGGDVRDGEAYLRSRLRGGAARGPLELAVVFGDQAAAAALADGPRAALFPFGATSRRSEEALAWLKKWVDHDDDGWPAARATRQLLLWAEELLPGAGLRGALAICRLGLSRWKAAGPHLEAIDAAEACAACPCRPHAARVLDAEEALRAFVVSAEERGAAAARFAREALEAVVGGAPVWRSGDPVPGLAIALAGGPETARTRAIQRDTFRLIAETLGAALVPWALAVDDPLRARHAPAPGEEPVPLEPPPRDPARCQLEEHHEPLPEDPFGPIPSTRLEVRHPAGVVWSGATYSLEQALRRLRFHVIAGRSTPQTTSVDGEALPLPYPPGEPAAQRLAIEEAVAACDAWQRAQRLDDLGRALAGATLRLDGLQLVVDVAGRARVVPVGPLEAGKRWEGVPWGDSGTTTWTELTLHLGPGDRLWLRRVDWEDLHLAGVFTRDDRWFVSATGAVWTPVTAPDAPGRQLGRVST